MIKEDVLNALRVLGFSPEEIDESIGYRFEYDGFTLIYSPDDEESRCITFMLPDVFDISDDNRIPALEAIATLCGKVRYVQAHIMFDSQVWLNYQHSLCCSEVTTEILEHMVRVLAYAAAIFHKIINGDNDEN